MEDLKQDISTVIAKSYSKESVDEFFEKYTFHSIFETLHHEGGDVNEQFLSRFSNFLSTIFGRFEKYVELFLFNPSPEGKQLLGYIVTHKTIEIRQLISLAIRSHIPKITALLNQSDDQTFTEYLGTLFKLLDDEETEVGLKALDVLSKIVKESRNGNFTVVKRPEFIEFIHKGLKHENSVIMMRYIDLLIEVTNLAEEVFELYLSKGLMEIMVQTYKTDDILVKLTVVEAIPKMGDSPWNSKYVNENLVQGSMLEECFDEKTDFYVRKNLLTLVAKLIARGILPLNQKMKALYVSVIKNWLNSGFKEELEGVLDIIANIVLRQSGVELIFLNEEIQISFIALSGKTDNVLRTKFLAAYAQVFSEELDKKLSAYMKKAFALVGNADEVVSGKLPISEMSTSDFSQSFKWLLKILHLPFVEIEQEALLLLQYVLRFDWSILEFAKQEKSLTYLLEHLAKGKELLDKKREIVRELIEKIDKMETKDIFLLEFKSKLVAGKAKLSDANNLSYATEVL